MALPLSDPAGPQPVQSLPRYEMVLLPLFMWGAWIRIDSRSRDEYSAVD